MDSQTGQLYSAEDFNRLSEKLTEDEKKKFKMVGYATPEQIQRMKVGRNEKCPCGSNRKFKNCCFSK